jgi:hypothetical protein
VQECGFSRPAGQPFQPPGDPLQRRAVADTQAALPQSQPGQQIVGLGVLQQVLGTIRSEDILRTASRRLRRIEEARIYR